MAQRVNRFKQKYESRTKTSTDDIVEQLYKSKEPEEKTIPVQTPEPVIVPEAVIPAPVVQNAPIQVEVQETPALVKTPAVKEKRKVGRPKKCDEERTIFNIKLTVTEKEMLDVAASACGKSRVDYLIGLLRADYESNKQYYEAVKINIMANK